MKREPVTHVHISASLGLSLMTDAEREQLRQAFEENDEAKGNAAIASMTKRVQNLANQARAKREKRN